jgi:hypothetical protein
MSAKYVGVSAVLERWHRGLRIGTRGPDVGLPDATKSLSARLERLSLSVGGLSQAAIEAAERLRDDQDVASAMSDCVPRLEKEEARRRVGSALAALGAGLADTAQAICCEDETLASLERRMGWSARSAKVVLKIALEQLASHYGLTSERVDTP